MTEAIRESAQAVENATGVAIYEVPERSPQLANLVLAMRGNWKRDPVGWAALKDVTQMHLRVWVLFDHAMPVSLNATAFGSRKKNAWEPYANWYVAFTTAPFRRRGYARTLARHVYALARAAGCVRVKSLAGSMGGFYLHAALGDHFWAVTPTLEVQVDSPLDHAAVFPSTTPANARKWTDRTTPLTVPEVLAQLGTPPALRYDLCLPPSAP